MSRDVGIDFWAYGSNDESLYGPKLAEVDVTTWLGLLKPDVGALIFDRPILRADLQVQKQSCSMEYVN